MNSKIISILFIIFMMKMNPTFSQSSYDKINFSSISITIDPYASYKENGLNIGLEVEKDYRFLYLRGELRNFSKLKGNYWDISSVIGLNFLVKNLIFYTGGRGGIIFRGSHHYPTLGFEGGINILVHKFIFGMRLTNDYRSDFKFWGGKNKMVASGYFKIGICI